MDSLRNRAQRVADVRARLTTDRDLWLATAGPAAPWLVPLWFLWHDAAIHIATASDNPTVRNIRTTPKVRVALDSANDVVLIDGTATVVPASQADDEVLAAYATKNGGTDPRAWAGAVIRVRPERVQAWRCEAELRGRLVMRDGHWLA